MWTIIGASYCNWCHKAEDLIYSNDPSNMVTVYEIDNKEFKWLKFFIKKANMSTVPQIFDPDGNHIGGYEDLESHFKKAA